MQTFNLQNSLFNTPDDKRHLVYFTGEGEPIKGGLGQDEIEEYKAELKSIEDKDRDLQTRVTEFQALTEELIEDIEELQFLLQDEVDESGFLKTEVEEGVGTELYGDSERLGLDEDDIQILKIAKGRVEDARTVSLAEQDIVGGTAYVSEALENLLGIEFTVALEDWEYSPEATTSFEKEYEKVGDLDSSKLSEIQIEQSIEDGGMTLFNEKGYEFTVPVPFRRAGEDPPYTLQTRSGEIKRTSQAGREKLISEGHGADSEPYKHYEYLIPVEYGGHDLYLPIGYITSGSRDALNSVMTRTAEPVADPAPEPVVAPTESDEEPDAVATADGSSIAFGSSMADAEAVDPAAEEPPTDEAEDPGDGVVEGESREEVLAREAAETPIEYFAFELPTFTKTLRSGDKGSEVKQLQVYLNQLSGKHEIFKDVKVADSGPGSPENEYETYDRDTERGVMTLQSTFYELGYSPVDPHGEFGPSTQQILKEVVVSQERIDYVIAINDPDLDDDITIEKNFLTEMALPNKESIAGQEVATRLLQALIDQDFSSWSCNDVSEESLEKLDALLQVISETHTGLIEVMDEYDYIADYIKLRKIYRATDKAKLICREMGVFFLQDRDGRMTLNLHDGVGEPLAFDNLSLSVEEGKLKMEYTKDGEEGTLLASSEGHLCHELAVAGLIDSVPELEHSHAVADAGTEAGEPSSEGGGAAADGEAGAPSEAEGDANASDESPAEGDAEVAEEGPEPYSEEWRIAILGEDFYSDQLEAAGMGEEMVGMIYDLEDDIAEFITWEESPFKTNSRDYYLLLAAEGDKGLEGEVFKYMMEEFSTWGIPADINEVVAKATIAHYLTPLKAALTDNLLNMASDPSALLAGGTMKQSIEENGLDATLEQAIRNPTAFAVLGGGEDGTVVLAIPKTDEDGNPIPDAPPEFLFLEQHNERDILVGMIDDRVNEMAESDDAEEKEVGQNLQILFSGEGVGDYAMVTVGTGERQPLTKEQRIAYLAKPESQELLKHFAPGTQEAIQKVGAKMDVGEPDRLVVVAEGVGADGKLVDRVVTGPRGAYRLAADVTGVDLIRHAVAIPPKERDKMALKRIEEYEAAVATAEAATGETGTGTEEAEATAEAAPEEGSTEELMMLAGYSLPAERPKDPVPNDTMLRLQRTLGHKQIEARKVLLERRIFFNPKKDLVPKQIFEKNQMADLERFHGVIEQMLGKTPHKRGPLKGDWQAMYKELYKNATGKDQKGFLTLGGNPLSLYHVIGKALKIDERNHYNADKSDTGSEFIGAMAATQLSLDKGALSSQGNFDAVTLMRPDPVSWREMEMYLSEDGMPNDPNPAIRAFAIFPNGNRPGETPLYITVTRDTDGEYVAQYGTQTSTHAGYEDFGRGFLGGKLKKLLGGRELDDITIYEIDPAIDIVVMAENFVEFQEVNKTVKESKDKVEQQIDRLMVKIGEKAGVTGPHVEKARRVKKALERYGDITNLESVMRATVESGSYRKKEGELANKMDYAIIWAYFEECGYEPKITDGREFDIGGSTRGIKGHHSPLEILGQIAREKIAAGEARVTAKRQAAPEEKEGGRSRGEGAGAETLDRLAYSPGDILDKATFTPKVKRAARGIYKDFLRKLSIGLTVNQAREVLEAGSLSALPGLPIKKRGHAEQLLMAVERMGEYIAKPDVRQGWHGLKRGEAAIFINGESPLHNLMRIAMYSAYGQVGTRRGIPGFADRVADIGMRKQPKKTCARPVRYRSRYDLPNVRRWS
ncbi:hypothetical protein HOG48_02495 [Candidatus Peregrinibacteria bacterium]|nr:hypothetical protein [Candidatus Peregrinibacteria bacterium]